jgi:hypothetical protein
MLKIVRFYISTVEGKINMKKFFITMSFLVLGGCSLKPKDPHSVNLRFYFASSSQSNLFSFLRGAESFLDSVNQANCLAVNVVGSGIDSTYDRSIIGTALEQLNKGEACTYRGVTSPPLSLSADASFDLSVPAGTRRFIQVLGFQDSNQVLCGKSVPFGEIYIPNDSNGVTGYELGREVRDLFTSQTITISNRYDALSADEKKKRNISCERSTASGGGNVNNNSITASSFTYSINAAGNSYVDCGDGKTALFGSVDCASFPLKRSCSSRLSSACNAAIESAPARFWYGSCDGGPAAVYAVCAAPDLVAAFSTQGFNASGIADCASNNSALFSNWACEGSNSRGSESCPATSGGACQTTVSQYWKNSCSASNLSSAAGLIGWATCVQNSGNPINATDITVVSGTFVTIDSTPSCAENFKAVAGQLNCSGDGLEMQTSCPLVSTANGLSCASSLENWGSSWYFKCSAAGSAHQYTLLCVHN